MSTAKSQGTLFGNDPPAEPTKLNYDAAVYCPKCNRLGPRDWWNGMTEPSLSLRDDEPEFCCRYCGHEERYYIRCRDAGAIEEHTLAEIIKTTFQQMNGAE